MNRFFVRHKLDISDICNLSDSDSNFVITNLKLKEEDIVEIETYDAIYLAVITNIQPNCVEVEIREQIEIKKEKDIVDISIVQSISNSSKFNFFLEKAVELGVDRVIPVQSQYSLINTNKAIKEYGLWKKIVTDATEQSRNIKPTVVEKPLNLNKLNVVGIQNKVCLATENVNSKFLNEYINDIDIKKPIIIAIGPEKGWGSKDIEIFKRLGFTFIKLKGNILRTETTGLVISSIIKYLKGEI